LAGAPPASELTAAAGNVGPAARPRAAAAPADHGWTPAPARGVARDPASPRPPTPPRRRAAPGSRAPQRPALPTRPGEPRQVLEASSLMAALAREATLEGRLALLEEWLPRFSEERAVSVLEGLLA